ncbi:MAG: hypothetical protein AAF602_30745 [Myxococcota bacterium]
MLVGLLLGCLGNDLVAADNRVFVAPISGDQGAFVDTTVSMSLQFYNPEFDDGFELKPYFGSILEPIEADVLCVDDVVMQGMTGGNDLALLLTQGRDNYDVMASGSTTLANGRTSRREGSAEAIVDLRFPCLDTLIPHEVTMDWVVVDGRVPPQRTDPE